MRAIILTACIVTGAAVVHAQHAARPLPQFIVYDAAGAAVSSATFAATQRSVVIYLRHQCQSCDQLLAALARIEDPTVASRLIIIVGGSLTEATGPGGRSIPKQLHSATWLADSRGDAWSALELKGMPVVMGVEGQQIEWRLAGAPNGRLLNGIVRNWLRIPGAVK